MLFIYFIYIANYKSKTINQKKNIKYQAYKSICFFFLLVDLVQ